MKIVNNKNLHVILAIAFFSVAGIFIVRYFLNIDLVVLESIEINWGTQACAFVVRMGGLFFAPLIWMAILINNNTSISYSNLYCIYAQSWVGRYIPGKVVYIGSRIYLAINAGIDKITASISVFLDGILQFAATLYVAALFFLVGGYQLGDDERLIYWVYAISAVMIVCLVPKIFNKFVSLGYRVLRRSQIPSEYALKAKPIIQGSVLALVFKVITGISVSLIALSVYSELSVWDFLYVAAVNSVASCIGMLAFFTPAGLGVREGFSIILLSLIFPREFVLVIVALIAVHIVIGDVVFFLMSLLYRRMGKDGSRE